TWLEEHRPAWSPDASNSLLQAARKPVHRARARETQRSAGASNSLLRAPGTAVCEVTDVSFAYGSGPAVLDRVSLELHRGEGCAPRRQRARRSSLPTTAPSRVRSPTARSRSPRSGRPSLLSRLFVVGLVAAAGVAFATHASALALLLAALALLAGAASWLDSGPQSA